MYYLRTQAARDAIKFTVDTSKLKKIEEKIETKKDIVKKKDFFEDEKASENKRSNIHVIDDDDPGLCMSCGA